jgi:exopolysaccharide biosynthesis polyprenyl glycosylphosphotransferase
MPAGDLNWTRKAATILDILLIPLMFLSAYYIRDLLGYADASDIRAHLALIPLVLSLWVFFLSYFGAYLSPRNTTLFDYSWAIFKGISLALGTMLAILFLLKIQYVSRLIITIFSGLSFIGLISIRIGLIYYFRKSIQAGKNRLNVLIIGTGSRAKKLTETLKDNMERGLHIIGYLDPNIQYARTQVLEAPVLGTVADITAILKDNVIDEIYFAIPRAMIPNVDQIALACEAEGVRLCLMADVFDVHVARMNLVELENVPLLTLEPVALNESQLLIKRIFDLVFILTLLPGLLPIMAIIAMIIKLDSRGPVFFIQDRVGKNKRRFSLYKFRTMVENAEGLLTQLEHLNEAQGPIFKIANDPRITRVGKFLRKTSLDELPQIINILRGEMSLVGPRPMSVRDVDLFDQGIQRKRFSVKPGLTCLWQVSGRSRLTFAKWLELDLFYIDHWSLGLDFKIMLKTIPAVIKGEGAM